MTAIAPTVMVGLGMTLTVKRGMRDTAMKMMAMAVGSVPVAAAVAATAMVTLVKTIRLVMLLPVLDHQALTVV